MPDQSTGPVAGTLADLITDAGNVGLDFNERLARDWHRRGLLASPHRSSLGRGQGSAPALYASEQRAVFQAVARRRAAGVGYPALAAIPTWAWLTYGNNWVDWEQLYRALQTAVGGKKPQHSLRIAEQAARDLVEQVDLQSASMQARAALRREIAQQLYVGRVDAARLGPRVAAVFEPGRLSLVRGPAAAPLTVESITVALEAKMLAAAAVSRLTEEQLGTARLQHLVTWAEYQQQRPQLAVAAGDLAALFDEPRFDQEVLSSVGRVLLLVGLQLRAARAAAGSQPS